MATVQSWFGRWVDRHMQRHPIEWPRVDDVPEFWRGVLAKFAKAGLTEDVADDASAMLMGDPRMKFRDQHAGAVVEAAALIFRERAAHSPPPDSREAAERLSRDCPECGGCGQTSRRFECAAFPGGVLSLTLGCLCAYGRWLTARRREGDDPAARGVPALADHPELWDPEDHHPTWPAEAGPPDPIRAVRNPRGGDPIELGRVLGRAERSRFAPAVPGPPRDRPGIPHLDHVAPVIYERDGRLVRVGPAAEAEPEAPKGPEAEVTP
jgi:hypothetical protein